MSSYTKDLVWQYDADGYGVTLAPFEFWCDIYGERYTVTIPTMTRFNGASIPRTVQKLFNWEPYDPRWIKAATIHDALVNEHGYQGVLVNSDGVGSVPSWQLAATVFDEALRVKQETDNCPDLNRRAFVAAVRFWGCIAHARTKNHDLGPRRKGR